ncbi:hypothetical protein ACPC54_06950 [Kitasatospora sp. NPDC094028]
MIRTDRRGAAPRLVLAAAGVALAVSGCGGSGGRAAPEAAKPAKAQVGHDTATVTKLFPELGEFSETTWVSRPLGVGTDPNARPGVPGPTDVEFDGVVTLPPVTLVGLMMSAEWQERPIGCAVPAELKDEIGGPDGWLHADAFDTAVTHGRYTGSFYLNRARSRAFFCTVNPKELPGVGTLTPSIG